MMRRVSLPAPISPTYNFSSPATVNRNHDHHDNTRDNSVETDTDTIVKLRPAPNRRVSILDRPDYRYFRDNGGGGVSVGFRKLSRRSPGILSHVSPVNYFRTKMTRVVVFTQSMIEMLIVSRDLISELIPD